MLIWRVLYEHFMYIYRFFAESLNLYLARLLFDTFCCSFLFILFSPWLLLFRLLVCLIFIDVIAFLSGNAKQLFHLVFECFCPSRWNLARVSWMNSSRIFCCWSCGYVLFSFIQIVWLLIYLIRISFMVRQRLWALEGFFWEVICLPNSFETLQI